MKRSLLVVVTMLVGWLVVPSSETRERDETQTATCTLKIEGMTCGGCEGAVKIAAKRVDGVTAVTASYKTRSAQVTYDPAKTTPEAIAKAVTERSGFKAEVMRAEENH